MTLDINIQHDLQKLQRDLSTLEHKAAPCATVRTLNRLADNAGIDSLFKARGNDEIMQKTVRDRFSTEFARNLAFYVNRMRKG